MCVCVLMDERTDQHVDPVSLMHSENSLINFIIIKIILLKTFPISLSVFPHADK